jgi:hypothetical protein
VTEGDVYLLNAAGAGGQYHPKTDSMAFLQPIPDEFPYIDFPAFK